MENLPLLIFPQPENIKRQGKPFFPKIHLPSKQTQAQRLEPALEKLQSGFAAERAVLADRLAGTEPEFVLVLKTAGQIDAFRRAVENTPGLEWLAEWDTDILADNDFYKPIKIGVDFFKNNLSSVKDRKQSKAIQKIFKEQNYIDDKENLIVDDISSLVLPEHLRELQPEIITAVNRAKHQQLKGRLFLSMSSQKGLEELLSLWNRWKQDTPLPQGQKKWKEVFAQIQEIRRWGIREQLLETGVWEDWKAILQTGTKEPIRFQLDLFYRDSEGRRRQNEIDIGELIAQLGGELISRFLDMSEIGFHSVKAQLPMSAVRRIVAAVDQNRLDIALLLFPGIMHYRPSSQAIVAMPAESELSGKAPDALVSGDPCVAILDGVPYGLHRWLENRLILDDPDNLEAEYQPGERKHGTAMASLIAHGELDANEAPLKRPIYFRPIMQADPRARGWGGSVAEYVPDDVFYEDRIARAVHRIFEGEGEVPGQAPTVKVINLSFGDRSRPFEHRLSPCARLIDWLTWKYKVLFCVSAGNSEDEIDLKLDAADFTAKTEAEQIRTSLEAINACSGARRLLSPAESINNITVAAIHNDHSTIGKWGNRLDILPNPALPSPINCLGHGFRRSVKPDILFFGGRQLYNRPLPSHKTRFSVNRSIFPPGQKVAAEGQEAGDKSGETYTRGTSNATALASRAAAKIHEALRILGQAEPDKIPDSHLAILIKALLVHGANIRRTLEVLENNFKDLAPKRKSKEFISKFVGYGAADPTRVLSCTPQRATVIACDTLRQKQGHEYRFPLPPSLANENQWRL